jgi:MFS family permease
LGRRRVFVAGLAVFALASLLVASAPSGAFLIAARALQGAGGLQGAGAAIVAASSLSLLTASFPEGRERTRAVAWYGAAAGIGASLGLVIGGALTSAVSWRAGFFINVPIGIAMIVLAPRYLPRTQRLSGRFDLVGALVATLGMSALVFAVVESDEVGWSSPRTITALVAGWRSLPRSQSTRRVRRSRSCRYTSSPAEFAPAPTSPGCSTSAT